MGEGEFKIEEKKECIFFLLSSGLEVQEPRDSNDPFCLPGKKVSKNEFKNRNHSNSKLTFTNKPTVLFNLSTSNSAIFLYISPGKGWGEKGVR